VRARRPLPARSAAHGANSHPDERHGVATADPAPGAWVTPAELAPSATVGWRRHAVSAALLVAMLGVVALRKTETGDPEPLVIGLAVLAWVPLLVRHSHPRFTLAGALTVEALHLAVLEVGPRLTEEISITAFQPVPLATMVAVWAYARTVSPKRGWTAGLSAATLLLGVAVLAQPLDLLTTGLVMANLVAIATAVGVAASARRERAVRADERRHQEVRREVQLERLRIARELHDVLAHHLTLVNAQAGVAEYLLRSDVDAAGTALRGIAEHTRQALDEVRATVGLLRQDDESDPASRTSPVTITVPTLDDVEGLVEAARVTGRDVRMSTEGTPRPLDAGVGLVCYRIVQEAMTNAARHAPGSAVHVHVGWHSTRLELTIENEAGTLPVTQQYGGGHGLLGMRERAAAAGGTVVTGPRDGGGYRVHASLPVGPAGIWGER
jgi:signal transduction histidine kinase